MTDPHAVPFRPVDFPPVDLEIETRADGTTVLTPRTPLEYAARSVPEGLARQAARVPDRAYLCERGPDGGWRRQSFAETAARAGATARRLAAMTIPAGRPVLIVSGNSIAHATVRYGAMAAGVPVCPVSANYALLGGGYERLKHVVDLVRPALIFAETSAYADAARAVSDVPVLTRDPDAFGAGAEDYAEWTAGGDAADFAGLARDINIDAPAAYMLTSGSTGKPKAVVQTQRMLTASLSQGWMALGRAAGWDDTLLEWLPWSHVSGAFSSMAAAIFGGTFYIDAGKPLPGLFDETVRNLREIPLRYFTNVPAGYAMLADALEADEALRETFFSKLRLMLYGGAGLPQSLYDRIQRLAVETVGARIFFTTGYGSTESTSGCMSIYFPTEEVGIGLPMPGLSAKLVPNADRFEVRLKGPNIMGGYLDAPEASAVAFDEEGFYKTGDTAVFRDADDPAKGLGFGGRLAEEFKLATGTWIAGGAVHAELRRVLEPYLLDLLVCGENQAEIGVLAWPKPGRSADDADFRAAVAERIEAHNSANPQSSRRVGRLAFLAEPPDPNAHELSDKGSVNQALAKRRRAAEVEALYAEPAGAGVLTFSAT
ncbi:MAG: AMP-binding protein [Pseudomonadota bacterium]